MDILSLKLLPRSYRYQPDALESRMLREERENKSKLPGVKLPDDILCTTDLEQTVEGKDILVLATASPSIRSMAKKMAPYVAAGQLIVDVSKGIAPARFP